MSEKVTLELRLADQLFKLSTTEEQRPQLERAAEVFNDKFTQLRRESPMLDRGKITIMMALEFAQEILNLNKTLQLYTHGEYLLQNIIDDLDTEFPNHFTADKAKSSEK